VHRSKPFLEYCRAAWGAPKSENLAVSQAAFHSELSSRGSPVGFQEGRTLNIDANFFYDLFLLISAISSQSVTPPSSSSLPLFRPLTQTRLISSPLQPPGDRAITMIGSRATPEKKCFGQISPGGPNASPGGLGPPGECLNETVQSRVRHLQNGADRILID
jgi:hypothetical protein